VPAFEVRLAGRSLPRDVLHDVVSVSYSDSLDQLDGCQLTLSNWDEERRDFRYVGRTSGSPPVEFRPGTPLELSIGYHDRGGLTLFLRGEVVSLSPDFPAAGQPTVQIRALNKLYRLHIKQEALVFEDKTDSEIAEAIVQRLAQELSSGAAGRPPLNLRLVTGERNASIEAPHPYLAATNDYPIVFLLGRARDIGYDLYIEEVDGATELHFHPPEGGTPLTYELAWGESLVTFKPTVQTKDLVSRVKVRGWDPIAKAAFEETATLNDLDTPGLATLAGMVGADAALAGSEKVIADEPVLDKQEAKQKAKGHLTRLANDLLSGSGTTLGLPELRAGRPVLIRRLGAPFSGRYLITATTHAIGDSGYTTQFEARMVEPDQPRAGS
jgi:phage protein D